MSCPTHLSVVSSLSHINRRTVGRLTQGCSSCMDTGWTEGACPHGSSLTVMTPLMPCSPERRGQRPGNPWMFTAVQTLRYNLLVTAWDEASVIAYCVFINWFEQDVTLRPKHWQEVFICVICVGQFVCFSQHMASSRPHINRQELHNLALQCSCWKEKHTRPQMQGHG